MAGSGTNPPITVAIAFITAFGAFRALHLLRDIKRELPTHDVLYNVGHIIPRFFRMLRTIVR